MFGPRVAASTAKGPSARLRSPAHRSRSSGRPPGRSPGPAPAGRRRRRHRPGGRRAPLATGAARPGSRRQAGGRRRPGRRGTARAVAQPRAASSGGVGSSAAGRSRERSGPFCFPCFSGVAAPWHHRVGRGGPECRGLRGPLPRRTAPPRARRRAWAAGSPPPAARVPGRAPPRRAGCAPNRRPVRRSGSVRVTPAEVSARRRLPTVCSTAGRTMSSNSARVSRTAVATPGSATSTSVSLSVDSASLAAVHSRRSRAKAATIAGSSGSSSAAPPRPARTWRNTPSSKSTPPSRSMPSGAPKARTPSRYGAAPPCRTCPRPGRRPAGRRRRPRARWRRSERPPRLVR